MQHRRPIPILHELRTFTPTGAWNTNVTYTGQWGRLGSFGYCEVKVALTGAPNAATLTVNLPFTVDTDRRAAGTSAAAMGWANCKSSGVLYGAHVLFESTTSVGLYAVVAAAGSNHDTAVINATSPNTFANNDFVCFTIFAPVVGWGPY